MFFGRDDFIASITIRLNLCQELCSHASGKEDLTVNTVGGDFAGDILVIVWALLRFKCEKAFCCSFNISSVITIPYIVLHPITVFFGVGQ